MDFSNLPDPFGSYLFRIPNTELTFGASATNKQSTITTSQQIPDEGLDYIRDPDMQNLMQREIQR